MKKESEKSRMLEIYNSNCATRAINTFVDFAGTDKLLNKELLVLTLMAYKGTTTVPYLKKILTVGPDREINKLVEQGYVVIDRAEGRTKYYKVSYKPVSSEVFSESTMYTFCNALFNLGKYVRDYKLTSWNILASMVELPLHLSNTATVNYEPTAMKCISGNKANHLSVRNKLVKYGVIKESRSEGKDNYKLNQKAYFLGV